MKLLLTTLFITLLSGCTLSQGHHFVVDSLVAEKKHDACGYFSSALPIGARNKAVINSDNFHLELCAIDYRSRTVAAGFIIPFIPVFGEYRQWDDVGWVKVTNLNNKAPLIINPGSTDDPIVREKIRINRSRYPNTLNKSGQILESKTTLASGSSMWMGLPLSKPTSVQFQSEESTKVVDFKSSTSFGWAMIMR